MVAFVGRWLICSRAVRAREEDCWFAALWPRLADDYVGLKDGRIQIFGNQLGQRLWVERG
jgi:hypothetical protein